MNKEWMKVYIAAFFEVFWVVGLKHAESFWSWSGTVLAIIISFYLLIMAGRQLPVGTVYAVFVGLGTAGTVFADIVFFGGTLLLSKGLLLGILLAGVIGLKVITGDQQEKGVDS